MSRRSNERISGVDQADVRKIQAEVEKRKSMEAELRMQAVDENSSSLRAEVEKLKTEVEKREAIETELRANLKALVEEREATERRHEAAEARSSRRKTQIRDLKAENKKNKATETKLYAELEEVGKRKATVADLQVVDEKRKATKAKLKEANRRSVSVSPSRTHYLDVQRRLAQMIHTFLIQIGT
jgi:chromosome segregation ATPase